MYLVPLDSSEVVTEYSVVEVVGWAGLGMDNKTISVFGSQQRNGRWSCVGSSALNTPSDGQWVVEL